MIKVPFSLTNNILIKLNEEGLKIVEEYKAKSGRPHMRVMIRPDGYSVWALYIFEDFFGRHLTRSNPVFTDDVMYLEVENGVKKVLLCQSCTMNYVNDHSFVCIHCGNIICNSCFKEKDEQGNMFCDFTRAEDQIVVLCKSCSETHFFSGDVIVEMKTGASELINDVSGRLFKFDEARYENK